MWLKGLMTGHKIMKSQHRFIVLNQHFPLVTSADSYKKKKKGQFSQQNLHLNNAAFQTSEAAVSPECLMT